MTDDEIRFRSLDGTPLVGTLTPTTGTTSAGGMVVLAHGAGVTREEGGFFGRLAAGLAAQGLTALRFDLRAHGQSGGRAQDITIAGIANDIRAACDRLRREAARLGEPVHVIAASFSGGAAALLAAHRPQDIGRLVLLNPRLDYRERYVTTRPGWADDYLSADLAQQLDERGFTELSPWEIGRGLLNECQFLDPASYLGSVRAPVLMVHGTQDTFVPVESSRHWSKSFAGPVELLELPGAQHGFAVHDDPKYADPQTQRWQAEVVEKVAGFLTES